MPRTLGSSPGPSLLTVDDLLMLIGQLYVEKRLLEFQLSQTPTPPPAESEETP